MKRILVWSYGGLGDTCMRLPFFNALRRDHPGAHICLAGRKPYLDLAVESRMADTAIESDGPRWEQLRKKAFDDPWDLCMVITDSKVVPGLSDMARQMIRIPSRVARMDGTVPKLCFNGRDAGQVRPHISEKLQCREPVLAVHAGSSDSKAPPAGILAGIMKKTVQLCPGTKILIIIGPADSDRSRALAHECSTLNPSIWNHPEPIATARRLMTCRAFLGPDGGPAHLAKACGCASAVLFGPTDPKLWAPVGASTFASSSSCAPCAEHVRASCRAHDCFVHIDMNATVNFLKSRLNSGT